jgi:hypothetical protein
MPPVLNPDAQSPSTGARNADNMSKYRSDGAFGAWKAAQCSGEWGPACPTALKLP